MTTAALRTRLAKAEAQVEAFAGTTEVPDTVTLMTRAGMVPDPWQQQVLTSTAPRQLLLCCRQSGKSQTAAALALGTALRQPGSLTLLLSPSLRQSQEIFLKVRRLYRALALPFPAEALTALRLELLNGSRVIALPGTEETIRGYSGVDLLVIDEAARVSDELYYALRPMLAISGGRLLALSTPFGKRGWFYTAYAEEAGWARTTLTAEACPRISAAFLAEERRSLPPLWFDSEYMCRFVDTVNSVFSGESITRAIAPEIRALVI